MSRDDRKDAVLSSNSLCVAPRPSLNFTSRQAANGATTLGWWIPFNTRRNSTTCSLVPSGWAGRWWYPIVFYSRGFTGRPTRFRVVQAQSRLQMLWLHNVGCSTQEYLHDQLLYAPNSPAAPQKSINTPLSKKQTERSIASRIIGNTIITNKTEIAESLKGCFTTITDNV